MKKRTNDARGPFVRWGDDPCGVRGEILNLWETQYGAAVTLGVKYVEGEVVAQGEDGERTTVVPGDIINVGLNNAMLEGTIFPNDLGNDAWIVFEGWQRSSAGRDYRLFEVFVGDPEES